MTPGEIGAHARGLIYRIAIVTGWVVPDDKEYRNVLYDQFSKKMVESYSDLNIDEILYAMRQYGTTVKDWGKSINLALIDEVIVPYIAARKEISAIEERITNPGKMIESTSEMIVDDDEFLNTVKSVYLKSRLTGLIPVRAYDLLTERKDIDLTNDEKAIIRARVEKRIENEATQGGMQEIRKLKDLKANAKEYERKVRNECKKEAVAGYFIKQNEIENF